jgi:hypothetical protein
LGEASEPFARRTHVSGKSRGACVARAHAKSSARKPAKAAAKRLPVHYAFRLGGQTSVSASAKADVAGRPVFAWDARGSEDELFAAVTSHY